MLRGFGLLLALRLVGVGANSADDLPPLDFYEVGVFDRDLHEGVLDPALCQEHLRLMSSFEFYDASFRVPKGMLQGNTLDFGNYHQCLGIDQEISETNHIYGKHCMINLLNISVPEIPWPGIGRAESRDMVEAFRKIEKYGNLEMSLERTGLGRTQINAILSNTRLGVCIPAACTPNEALDRFFDGPLIGVNYESGQCRLLGDRPRVAADYVAIVVFLVIGLVTIISTCYDIRHTVILKQDPKQLNQLYSCASLYSNTRRLLTFSSSQGALSCIDGIRSLSIIWIILGHCVLSMVMGGVQNIVQTWQWYVSWEAVWLQANNITVDSFFMMSGLLLVYTSANKLTQGRLLVYTSANKLTQGSLMKNLHLFYLNRLLRMFPILATCVLLEASFFNRLSDGANWPHQGRNVEYCRRHWWAALLHIQNFYNNSQICLPHTWYLAVDIQLHILSPVVLFWVLGGRRGAWTAVVLAFFASLAVCIAYVFLVVSQPDKVYKLHYYENTLTRAPPFFVGFLYGYVLHVFRNKKLKLTPAQVSVGWVVSLLFLVGAVCSFYPIAQSDFDSQTYTNMFLSFTRTCWAIGLGWVIVACAHGYGGPINWFLSLMVFKFLARISFAMYLLHYQIQFIRTGSITAPFYFSVPYALLRTVTELSLTVLVSFIVTVVIDTPFSTAQKMLLAGGKRKSRPKSDPVNEETKPKEKDFVHNEAR